MLKENFSIKSTAYDLITRPEIRYVLENFNISIDF